jgi:VanZ family protein
MTITRKTAGWLLVVLVLLLLAGTQMPGAWRNAIVNGLHHNWGLSSWGHLAMFTCMAFLARISPLRQSVLRIAMSALALALLTEGLQFFAIDRHPGWGDVAIDLAGAALGLLLARLQLQRQT